MANKKNNSREQILEKIRSALKDKKISGSEENTNGYQNKDEKRKINYVLEPDLFIKKLEATGATVSFLDNINQLVQEVHKYVADNQINSTLTVSNDTNLSELNWQDIDVSKKYDAFSLTVSVNYAWMGIEETGTIVLLSSEETPTGLNFLPDHHMVVLSIKNIVKEMEDVWQLLRDADEELPRTVNLITGPSRTADIEQEIQIGAHGPKYLHVVLIKN